MMQADIDLLVNNAKQYNEDSSLLYQDAVLIGETGKAKINEELNKHPELQELEGGSSRDGGSTAPGTTQGTPAPSGLKLKLNLGKATNGDNRNGSSAIGSDDDE